jgi:hypothetical protein
MDISDTRVQPIRHSVSTSPAFGVRFPQIPPNPTEVTFNSLSSPSTPIALFTLYHNSHRNASIHSRFVSITFIVHLLHLHLEKTVVADSS